MQFGVALGVRIQYSLPRNVNSKLGRGVAQLSYDLRSHRPHRPHRPAAPTPRGRAPEKAGRVDRDICAMRTETVNRTNRFTVGHVSHQAKHSGS
jgi:hypothetical protein